MKNLLITVAMLLLVLTMMDMQMQCSQMLRTKGALQEVARDAAFAAFYSKQSFQIPISQTGREKAESIIRQNLKTHAPEAKWQIQCEKQGADGYRVTVLITYRNIRTLGHWEGQAMQEETRGKVQGKKK